MYPVSDHTGALIPSFPTKNHGGFVGLKRMRVRNILKEVSRVKGQPSDGFTKGFGCGI